MIIPIYGLIFMAGYLLTIWTFNVLMVRGLGGIPTGRRQFAKWLALANIFLASGDTIFFTSFVVGRLSEDTTCQVSIFNLPLSTNAASQPFLTVPGGIVITSITVSCYYLFLGLYYRDKFTSGKNDALMWSIYALFAARILLHFNPNNIWMVSCLPDGTPNYSAWLRNTPLFLYGLLTVTLVGWHSRVSAKQESEAINRKIDNYMAIAMILVMLSFLFYGLDIFFSHLLPEILIWLTYIFKTIAYVVPAIIMWHAEYDLAPRTR